MGDGEATEGRKHGEEWKREQGRSEWKDPGLKDVSLEPGKRKRASVGLSDHTRG